MIERAGGYAGGYKRIVVTLPQSNGAQAALTATALLAELLRLNLVATFIEDSTLMEVAGLPYVRELRPLGGGWRPIEAAQLAEELERAARAAHRLVTEVAQSYGIEATFTRVRGSVGEIIGSVVQTEDIVVIIEPRHPIERITQQFTSLVNAALRASAAVLIMPSRIARTEGPIVAVAARADDPSIHAALAIAAAAGEKLVLVMPESLEETAAAAERAESAGIRAEILSVRSATPDVHALGRTLSDAKGRLIVMTRGVVAPTVPVAVASLTGIPVLLVEPVMRASAPPKGEVSSQAS